MVLMAKWGILSKQLTADLMVYDSLSHPDPARFDKWARGSECPYSGVRVQRAACFQENKQYWGLGKRRTPFYLMTKVIQEKCGDSDFHKKHIDT
jgi:hypothetical protein